MQTVVRRFHLNNLKALRHCNVFHKYVLRKHTEGVIESCLNRKETIETKNRIKQTFCCLDYESINVRIIL